MTLEEYFGRWWRCFDLDDMNKLLPKLTKMYGGQTLVYPAFKNVFKAFKACDYDNLSVVIIGQDPYFDGKATGLAFANEKGTEHLSPSLEVLKKCVYKHSWTDRGFDCTLSSWARQGVLLLNSSLTVEANKPGSHSLLWRMFLQNFLTRLGWFHSGIIYVLLGSQAKSFKPYIGKYNDIIECAHPAYYARTGEEMPDIFEEIDRLTMSKNGFKIKWV